MVPDNDPPHRAFPVLAVDDPRPGSAVAGGSPVRAGRGGHGPRLVVTRDTNRGPNGPGVLPSLTGMPASPRIVPLLIRSRFAALACVRRAKIAGGFRGVDERADGPEAASALAAAFGALEAVGPFSFAPVRVGASIIPSDIQFDISDFLGCRRRITAPTCNSRCLRCTPFFPDPALEGRRPASVRRK